MPRTTANRNRYDLVVLGGGTGGIVASLIAARVGARVALIERDRLGGDCLWTGCVPSKSLLAAAELAHRMRDADSVGLAPHEPEIDFGTVMAHVQRAIRTIEPQDSPERLRREGVHVIEGEGRFEAPGIIAAGGSWLRWRRAIVATGSSLALPPVEGLAEAAPLTTETVWQLRELPERLVVLGGGPSGCELGQAFARLGARVTVVELADRLLLKEEPRASRLIADRLCEDGIDVRVGSRATRVEPGALTVERAAGETETIPFDRILVAAGRAPRTRDLGLERVGVEVGDSGAVIVDANLRTTARSVYAVGDVTGLLPFTHVAAIMPAWRHPMPCSMRGARRTTPCPG
jgi:pyruvate/2-oxoglutarate dehydrogenase complex dihydrolipoamide dehydrogenase (E3) component